MKISINEAVLKPFKDALLVKNHNTHLAKKRGGDGFSPVEGFHTAVSHRGKTLGCNCGDEILVVATMAEVDTSFDAGTIAVIQSVADALIAAGADILEA